MVICLFPGFMRVYAFLENCFGRIIYFAFCFWTPVYNNTKTEKQEALWIADTILQAVANGKKYSDHSILVRVSTQTRAVEEAFV